MKFYQQGNFSVFWMLLVCLLSLKAQASHIVGGEITYQCLGNDNYQISLTYYRDCSGVVMPASTDIIIKGGMGNVIGTYTLSKGPSTYLNVNQVGCGQPTPTICVETAQYVSGSINLPSSPFGYVIFNQQCCRNNSVDNILNAYKTGATVPAYIQSGICNNSAEFSAYPPVALPMNVPLNIAAGATDADGDSLYYELCAPLNDVSANAPFNAVGFASGFSASNMVPSNPPLAINHATGEITGTINQIGKYAVAICVKEYRNGNYIGKIQRDYQFTVIAPWSVFSSISGKTDASCTGGGGSATVSATGASGPYTYNWSNGQTTATATNLAPGNYSVITTSAGGCKDTATVVINGGAAFTASITAQTPVSCGNPGGGSATIAVTGGTAPYTITWPDATVGNTHNNLTAGIHKVAISDASGCIDTISVNIANNIGGVIASVTSKGEESCTGSFNGFINIEVTNGIAPFTYLWNDGSVTKNRDSLSAGNYSVVVTDANGCTTTLNVNVSLGNGITASWDSINPVACSGKLVGYLGIAVSGGTKPYTYRWNNAATTSAMSNLGGGNYWVVITDANGCSDSIFYNLINPLPVRINSATLQHPSCHDNSDGNIQINITGGTAPYNILWSTSDTGSTLNNLGSGSYGVTVTDSRGCSINDTYVLSAPDSLELSIKSHTAPACTGNGGTISLGITGGTKPYAISWNNGQQDSTAINLVAGTYTATVTDSNGCSSSINYTLTAPVAIVVAQDTVQSASCGQANGFASISVSGGHQPYSISWSNGQNGPSISSVNSGIYTAVVTDSLGCVDSLQLTIPAIGGFTALIDSISAPSCGGNDGYARIVPQNGSAPFSYNWSSGATGNTANNLSSGAAYVVVTDANGCSDSVNFVVPATDSIKVFLSDLQHPSCHDNSDGNIQINITGGTAPYNILWSTSDTGSTLNNLGSGSYGVTVTDSRGCSISDTYVLSAPDSLELSIKSHTAPACTGNGGTISLGITGGTKPYVISWNNGQQDSTAINLVAGTYTATVTDSNGCSSSINYTLTAPVAIVVAQDTVQSASCGQANGFASISVSGGIQPYSISWSNGQSGPLITNVNSGMYTALVTDSLGCVDSLQLTIPAIGGFTALIDSISAPSCGGNDGYARVVPQNGSAPFSYNWSSGATGNTANNLSSGAAYVVVTDANGCSDSVNFVVPAMDSIKVFLSDLQHPSCHDNSDGNIQINITGGTAPYNILWSTSDTGSTLNNLGSGSYGVTVTDSRGCSISDTYFLSAPDSLELSIKSHTAPACAGNGGTISLGIAGGTKPYAISWNNGQQDSTAINLVAGTYTATVTDSNGCSSSINHTLTAPVAIVVAQDTVQSASCGQANGFASISVSGGHQPYSISWSNGQNGPSISSVNSGMYTAVITDSLGCVDSLQLTIPAIGGFTALIDSISAPSCGGNDGYARIVPQNGSTPFSYNWSSGATGNTANNLSSGAAYVVVTDANGCSDSVNFVVPATDSLTISLVNLVHPLCAGQKGSVQIAVHGGQTPYNILWGNNSTGMDLLNASVGIHIVNVTDANGCSVSAQYEILGTDSFIVVVDSLRDPSCHGGTDGAVFLRALGNNVISSIVPIKGKAGIADMSKLGAGNYSVWVENTNGCGTLVEFEIGEPAALAINDINVQPPGCDMSQKGVIELSVSGGVPPYSYSWNDGVSTRDRYDVGTGYYTLTVTDFNGCVVERSYDFSDKDMKMHVSQWEMECGASSDARLEIRVEGAAYPYELTLNGREIYEGNMNVDAGTYTLQLKDADNCIAQQEITVHRKSEKKLYFANAFTPNDDGVNDLYEIKGSSECFSNARLEIFNRWGARIFVSDRPFDHFWDGRINGEISKTDTYVYSFTSEEHVETGYLNIVR